MCGIAGWLGQDIDIRYSTEILKRLIHRGPDGGGEWRCEGVWFGHRRLAVLDLTSDGRQPMLSASGRYVLTYNGEVYNYLELRCELEQAGVAFRGHSARQHGGVAGGAGSPADAFISGVELARPSAFQVCGEGRSGKVTAQGSALSACAEGADRTA